MAVSIVGPHRARALSEKWPFRGKEHLAALLGVRANTLPAGEVIQTADGCKFRIRRDPSYLRLFLDGGCRSEELKMLRALVRPGDVIVDASPGFGLHAVLFGREVSPNGAVHAFAPTMASLAELTDHVGLNGLDRIVRTPSVASGGATSPTWVDDYCLSEGVREVHLIRVDADLVRATLRGATKLLNQSDAPWILFDLEGKGIAGEPSRSRTLAHELKEAYGFDGFFVYRRGSFVPLLRHDDASDGESVLAVKGTRCLDRLGLSEWPPNGAEQITPIVPVADSVQEFPRVRRRLCPICGGHDHEALGQMKDDRYGMPEPFELALCKTCGTAFITDPVAPEAMGALYEKYYGTVPSPRKNRRLRGLRATVKQSAAWSFMNGGIDLSYYVKSGQWVLDVGCSYGGNADVVKANGATWVGLDLDPKVHRYLQEEGFESYCATLEDFAGEHNQRFDVILMSQVIEHCFEPIKTLKAAANLLTPGGEVILSCPNGNSRFRKIAGTKWLSWHVPYHLVQLTEESLGYAARRTGLEVVSCVSSTPPSWYFAQQRALEDSEGEFQIPLEPFKWMTAAPFLRIGDVLTEEGGDALIVRLRRLSQANSR